MRAVEAAAERNERPDTRGAPGTSACGFSAWRAEAATGRVGAAMRWASFSFMLATVCRFAGLTLNSIGVLTGGVQERADCSLACERVVEVHGGARLKDVHFDGGVCEQGECLLHCLQSQVHAPAEDHDLTADIDELSHVDGLDAGLVPCAGLAPIPFASTAWVELEVASARKPLDLDSAPRQAVDLRGWIKRHGILADT
jgi:hypothetical protein